MFDIATVTEFFGWCSVLNMAFLVFSSIMLAGCRRWVLRYHQKLFGIEESKLNEMYFSYLSHYKIITVTLFLIPYIALKIMA